MLSGDGVKMARLMKGTGMRMDNIQSADEQELGSLNIREFRVGAEAVYIIKNTQNVVPPAGFALLLKQRREAASGTVVGKLANDQVELAWYLQSYSK